MTSSNPTAASNGQDTPLPVRRVALAELHQDPGNARTHDRRNLDAIKASLQRFGQVLPIVVRQGRIVGGNATTIAADELGWTHLDVTPADHLSEEDATALAIALNRTGELASWDTAVLLDSLQGLPTLEGTGYTAEELAELEAALGVGGGGVGLTDPDDVPEPPVEPVTRPGDLWLLGPHRLLCGDATKREEVTRLLDGVQPDIMVTDPPYGVAVGGDKGKMSIHGDLTQAVIPVSFAVAVEHLAADARVYLFGGSSNWGMYAGLFDAHLRMQVRPIVWVKESFVLRPNNYHSQFEMVYFGWKGRGGANDLWFGDRTQSDVWQVSRGPVADKLHLTQKPVEACAIPIRNSCPPGGAVYEPFAGSGSTLIAAQDLGRACYAIELDAGYCDTICRRWQEHTGEKPILEATGEPHDFTSAP